MALLGRDWDAGAKAVAEANKQLNKQAVFMVTWNVLQTLGNVVERKRCLSRDLATSNCQRRTRVEVDAGQTEGRLSESDVCGLT